MKKLPLECLSKFVLRSPVLPLNVFFELTKNKMTDSIDYIRLFNEPLIEESIFMASPHLHNELSKWSQGIIIDEKKIQNIKISFCKYISRMCSRCTPFGTFAGCTVGELNSKTNLVRSEKMIGKRFTRLDMNYLVALAHDISKMKEVRRQILFFPNSSIYEVGNHIRYIEYKYIKGFRTHYSMAIDSSIYLNKILKIAQNGSGIKELIECLISEEITFEESQVFINELIDSQVLVSELEPPTTGKDFLLHIRNIIKKLKGTEEVLKLLDEIQYNLDKINSELGLKHDCLSNIFKVIEAIGTEYDKKYIFQTDFTPYMKENKLNRNHIDSVQKAILLFNKLTPTPNDSDLEKFKKEFQKRFDNREISLGKALDVECGIGYLQNNVDNDINPLIDDLILPKGENKNQVHEIKYTKAEKIIKDKIDVILKSNVSKVHLTLEDFQDLKSDWNDVPSTFSSMTELIIEEGEEKIKINGAGGNSAANLLGRFCHLDEQIDELCSEIISFEDGLNSHLESAEIAHLPESRIGNILLRPSFRNYEIPYLASSNLPRENQISIKDLYISMEFGELKLKSKKLKKSIIPRLTNAHNYSAKSLPIYHFLCDLQSQNKRLSLYFGLGKLFEDYDFIPRIEFDKVILFEATWILKSEEIKPLLNLKNDDQLFKAFENLAREKKIPNYVRMVDGDNILLVNVRNLDSLKGLLNESKRKNRIVLKEFLFSDNQTMVKKENKNDFYTNQIILSFKNKKIEK